MGAWVIAPIIFTIACLAWLGWFAIELGKWFLFDLFKNQNATYRHEYGAWDEVDGGTYVTMEDGTVRLDNDGGKRWMR